MSSFAALEFPSGPENLTESIGIYMIYSMARKLGIPLALPEPTMSYELLVDCEMIVGQVFAAFNNPSESSSSNNEVELTCSAVKLPWSIEEYAAQLTPQQNISTELKEANLQADFPPLFSGDAIPLLRVPCTVVDKEGVIVLWYLPGALTRSRLVSERYLC
jgi:hypothetical protein